jgi:hypothetical protein
MLEQHKIAVLGEFGSRLSCFLVPENILIFNHEPLSSGCVACSDTSFFFPFPPAMTFVS